MGTPQSLVAAIEKLRKKIDTLHIVGAGGYEPMLVLAAIAEICKSVYDLLERWGPNRTARGAVKLAMIEAARHSMNACARLACEPGISNTLGGDYATPGDSARGTPRDNAGSDSGPTSGGRKQACGPCGHMASDPDRLGSGPDRPCGAPESGPSDQGSGGHGPSLDADGGRDAASDHRNAGTVES